MKHFKLIDNSPVTTSLKYYLYWKNWISDPPSPGWPLLPLFSGPCKIRRIYMNKEHLGMWIYPEGPQFFAPEGFRLRNAFHKLTGLLFSRLISPLQLIKIITRGQGQSTSSRMRSLRENWTLQCNELSSFLLGTIFLSITENKFKSFQSILIPWRCNTEVKSRNESKSKVRIKEQT